MALFLILGALLGAVSVIFVLQNITPITVSFFAWQIEGSLAIILFLALLSGMFITLLMFLPGFIRDEFRFSALKKQNKDLENELTATKKELADVSARTPAAPTMEQVM